jgi:large subunit ribosomal protein L25
VTSLAEDGHVAAKDLALPEGVSVRLPPEQTVASIVHEIMRGEDESAAAPGAAAGAAPAAGAAAAAPAAGAAAAKGAAPSKAPPAKAPAKK